MGISNTEQGMMKRMDGKWYGKIDIVAQGQEEQIQS